MSSYPYRQPWWRVLLELTLIVMVFAWVLDREFHPVSAALEAAMWMLAAAALVAAARWMSGRRSRDRRGS